MIMSQTEVERIKEKYPAGTKIVLDKMGDIQAPPIGTIGTVTGVDDCGDLLMHWETGSSLKVILGIDIFHVSKNEEGENKS